MSHDAYNHSVCMAVLPFENLSDNRDYEYFASGFVEDLITDLSHFNSLQVISSYTSRKMGGAARDILSEAKALSVDYLLKGNLRRMGDQVRINTQLLDTNRGGIVWADHYDAPLKTIFDIQDDIVERVAGAISNQIDTALLAAARKKPLTSLAAYDCWLRGMELLRQGTPESDREARKTFEQALTIDPHYSRTYAGLSLSYFNDWSCQLWDQYDAIESNAYKYAKQAIQLDDTDHITQLILGRILIYRQQFDLAQQHVDQSLALNSNDADILILISTCKAFLGQAKEGEELFLKALRLNPYRSIWYYTGGAFTYFSQGDYETCIDTALKGPLTDVWLDLPAFIAAAYAHLGEHKEAARYLKIFTSDFQKKIITDHAPSPDEIITWMKRANPYRYKHDRDRLVNGLQLAGLGKAHKKARVVQPIQAKPISTTRSNTFIANDGLWQMIYEEKTIQIPEVKGFLDIARLLATPGVPVHCTEIMGNPDSLSEDTPVADNKALKAYEKRLRELREEIQDAEEMNDLGRSEKLNAELDQLTDHISKALGIGRRSRRLNAPAERARAAVTWRIRSAIKKIEAAHPSLGRHLTNAVRTGTFCCYDPEKEQGWIL